MTTPRDYSINVSKHVPRKRFVAPRRDLGPAEVCDCRWFNDVQIYACMRHRGAA